MVMTHMSMGKNFFTTAKNLINAGGVGRLYSGFAMTAMRDGWFGVGFMAAPAALEPIVRPYVKYDGQANLLSKVVAGVGAAVVSQAFDTVKTVQQTAEKGQGIYAAVKKPYTEHGMFGYFKGGLPRGARVASAVCIMSFVSENMNTFFTQRNKETKNSDESAQNAWTRGSPD